MLREVFKGKTYGAMWWKKNTFPNSVEDWIQDHVKNFHNISVIWKVVLLAFPLVGNLLAWSVWRGTKVQVGVDHWIACGEDYKLPVHIIQNLRSRGIYNLN